MFVVMILAWLVISGISSRVLAQGASDWPRVVPVDTSIYFADADKTDAVFKILDLNGNPVYVLQCYNGRDPRRDRNFNYSGDFECRLSATYGREGNITLLNEPQHTKEWESRGRVLGDELVGKCADYPEYGRVRHFRLRKMKITFSFDEVSFKPFQDPHNPKVKKVAFQSLRFNLRVEQDPKALSAMAEAVPFAYPPPARPDDPNDFALDCSSVIKRRG